MTGVPDPPAPPRTSVRRLTLLVFFGGACTLATEMAGARLLAPWFGTSNLVWANVIGLILLYLSVGYWVGGKLADRWPDARVLGWVVAGAAGLIALLPFISRPLFGAAAGAFDDLSTGAYVGSFLGTMLLFAVPITALGALSPWAIRLAVDDVASAGTVIGRMYAVSTIGSLLGTFIPVLLLVPLIGTQRTIIGVAAVLAAVTLPLLPRRAIAIPVLIAALLAIPPGSTKSSSDGRVIFETDSGYQYVQVVERRSGDRVLHLNEGWAVHSILPADGPATGGYWDAFMVLPLLTGRDDGSLAVLGNAGGTIANLYAAAWPDAPVEGVEIDPVVTDVGRRYLGMTNPRLHVTTADARTWVRATDATFDAMVVDAYRQPYLPFHLVSREFFALVGERLTPDGVVAINVGTPPGQTEAVDMIAATMRDVFPTVQAVRFDDFNSVVFGFRAGTDLARTRALLSTADGLVARPAALVASGLGDVAPGGRILTDDHAPIEWITDRALLAYLRDGAPGA